MERSLAKLKDKGRHEVGLPRASDCTSHGDAPFKTTTHIQHGIVCIHVYWYMAHMWYWRDKDSQGHVHSSQPTATTCHSLAGKWSMTVISSTLLGKANCKSVYLRVTDLIQMSGILVHAPCFKHLTVFCVLTRTFCVVMNRWLLHKLYYSVCVHIALLYCMCLYCAGTDS